MSDVFSDEYWQNEFAVTQADMDRLATFITEAGRAQDLTVLVKRVIRGRLRHGSVAEEILTVESSPAGPSVRLWDPAAAWTQGDLAIFPQQNSLTRQWSALIGEITSVKETEVSIFLPSTQKRTGFILAESGSVKAQNWHKKVQEIVAEKRLAQQAEEQGELILLTYGERVASQLLEHLREDERFVRLSGRWFLRDLAQGLTPEQIEQVAWHLLVAAASPTTTDLLTTLALSQNDPVLFGLYLALRDHPNLFQMLNPGPEPAWQLVGPPPGSFTPRFPAYDPVSYTILCRPGIQADAPVVSKLWETGLLQAVI